MATSEFTCAAGSASGLQMVCSMKRVAIAILAMIAVSGCGVGADESYDGQNLVSASGEALTAAPEAGPQLPAANGPQTPETTAPSPIRDPSTVALPQDPIPVFEGRPLPQTPSPMMEGQRGPTPNPGLR